MGRGRSDPEDEEAYVVITDKRKTLGVFMNKADLNFQNTVQKVTRRRARELGYDISFISDRMGGREILTPRDFCYSFVL